jgi:hypothetical protein
LDTLGLATFEPLALEMLLLRDFVAMLMLTLELEVVLLGSLVDSVLEVVEKKLGTRVLSTSFSLITSFPVTALRSLICSLKSTYSHQQCRIQQEIQRP